jgi:23S rRNA pseudouridine955/2504/2580 synthase
MRDLVMTEHEAGVRLDRYLRKLLPRVPLSAIFKHLRNGGIRVDGRRVDGDLRLARGMHVQLVADQLESDGEDGRDEAHAGAAPPAAAPATPAAKAAPIQATAKGAAKSRAKDGAEPAPRIVHQDEQVLVIAKPAGLAVHGGSGIKTSVVDWLAAQRVGVRTGTWKPAPAHRLDRGTSGLLLIGLVPEALRKLTAAFRAGEVAKVYHAVVHGVPAPKQGAIVAPLRSDPKADRREAKVVVDPRGQPARTEYEVVRSVRHLALLRVVPREGRQHQIRAHLAHLGHAIMGDNRYGSPADLGRAFLLHCSELEFVHPASGKKLRVRDAIPPAMLQLFAPE